MEAMARTLRKPLPEDIDFMHASREEMLALQRAIYPLTRTLAARLAQRRKRRHRGSLDFRKTVRASLSYGGVPAEPKFRHPHPSKPEIMVVADISGSVASFARFTLQFVHTMASQFSKVRSWVFIDGIDEVTRFFQESEDIGEAVHKVNTEADVVWVDGHSDYGHTFQVFHDRHLREITNKSSVILLGDARNNYHASQAWVVNDIQKRARHVYWLNPEPAATGTPATRSSLTTPPTATASTSVATCASSSASSRPSPRAEPRRSAVEEIPGPVGDARQREELRPFAAAERMAVAPDQQCRIVGAEQRDRKILGAGRAVRDQRRRGGPRGQRDEQRLVGAARSRIGEHPPVRQQRGPVGEELVAEVRHQFLLQRRHGVGLAQARRGLERVETGVGERADDARPLRPTPRRPPRSRGP